MMEARQVKTVEPKATSEEKRQSARSADTSRRIFQLYLAKADNLLDLNNRSSDDKNASAGASDQTREAQTGRAKAAEEASSKNIDWRKMALAGIDPDTLLSGLPGFNPLYDNLLSQLQLARMLEVNSSAMIDWTGLVDQIVEKVQLSKTLDLTNLEIVLKPDWLGKLTLKLSWQDSLVNINLVAEAKVKEILEANLDALKNALASQGINLGQLETSLSQQNKNGDQLAGQDQRETNGLSATGLSGILGDQNAAMSPAVSGLFNPTSPDFLYQVGQKLGVSCNLVRMVV